MDLYRDIILDLYRNPHNKGRLATATHSRHETNPTCGDEVTVDLIVENGVVQNVTFDGVGCAISVAASSLVTDAIQGKSIKKILGYTKADIDEWFGFSIVYTRENCAMLTLKAIQKVLSNI